MQRRYVLLTAVALVLILQCATLNGRWLNGDEAIYVTILEEARKLFSHGMFSLNPVIDYAGPLDFWCMGSVYAILTSLGIEAGAWMVRIVPFSIFWIAMFLLFKDVRARDKDRGAWLLFLAAICPLVAVYTRVAWPHSLLLGTMTLLLRESLRISRGERARLILIALLVGCSAEAHSSAFIGCAAILAPVLPSIFKEITTDKKRAALSALLFALLLYPVARNFPPPVEGDPGLRGRYWLQLRSLLNVLSGFQPFSTLFSYDSAPIALQIVLMIFPIATLGSLGFALRRKTTSEDGIQYRAYLISLLAGTGLVLLSCSRGRSLEMQGHERHLLALTPLGVLLVSEGLNRVLKAAPARTGTLWSSILVIVLLGSHLIRFSLPLFAQARKPDSALAMARYLKTACPRSRCLVYAEDFWDYWPLRFYSQDSVDVNFSRYNWKRVVHHEANGRSIATCWLGGSQPTCSGAAREKAEFTGEFPDPGHICALDCAKTEGMR